MKYSYSKNIKSDFKTTEKKVREALLDIGFEPKKNSRLSCQLIVSDEIDGLIVDIPEKQI